MCSVPVGLVGCLRNAHNSSLRLLWWVAFNLCISLLLLLIIDAALSFLGSAATQFFPLLLLNAMQT